MGAVDTRRYTRAENRVWSDQEDHEERESKDRATSTCGPHSDSFNDTSRPYDSRSTLIVMHRTLTGQRYVDDILRPHVGPFLNGLPEAIFQQDNARPHTARVAQDFLRHFQTLPWWARSPDLPL
ncbi:uncharacterized protein TNCV_2081641 [Trichonephila clavipes]|nr:uncharacterized protein TNCV_2081641 [Trichonephila clavipes]